MLEFALSQETVRAAPLLPPEEGREENNMFNFISEPTFSKKEQFPFLPGSQVHGTTVCESMLPHSRPRPILPAAKRAQFGDAVPPHTPLASPVWDSGSLARMPQNAPAFCIVQSYYPSLHHYRYIKCTLKVYVAAIMAHHDAVDGRSLGKHGLIVRFLKGARRMNPSRSPLMPSWDLSIGWTSEGPLWATWLSWAEIPVG